MSEYETYTNLEDGKIYVRIHRKGRPILFEDIIDGYLKYEQIRDKNSKAGKSSMSKMTKEERSERARKAVQARWNKNQ